MSPVALITGSNRGIGHEVARQLAARGYRVVVTSRDAGKAKRAAAKIGPSAVAHSLDVSDPNSIDEICQFVEKEIGSLDVLVNNAAILLDEGKNIVDVEPDEFEGTWRANTFGPFLMTKRFAALLRKSGHGRVVKYRPVPASSHRCRAMHRPTPHRRPRSTPSRSCLPTACAEIARS